MSALLPVNTILHADCMDVLRTLPDASVDAVIADPPYGTTPCHWDKPLPLAPLWRELRRVVRPHGAIVLFATQPFTSLLIASNVKQFRHEWIWQKERGGGYLNVKRMPLKRHESIVVFSYGAARYYPQMRTSGPYRKYSHRRSTAGATVRDQALAGQWTQGDGASRYPTSVLTYAIERGLHPTQKPVPLLRYLVRTYTQPGDVVLDFAAGSGSTAVAALLEERRYLGVEREAKYAVAARKRLAATVCESLWNTSALQSIAQ